MTRKMPVLLLFCLLADGVSADGFRCGTRLVRDGDPVNRVMRACGAPDHKVKARLAVRNAGREREVAVTQWVYERRGNPPMIVSVRDGRVVRIERG